LGQPCAEGALERGIHLPLVCEILEGVARVRDPRDTAAVLDERIHLLEDCVEAVSNTLLLLIGMRGQRSQNDGNRLQLRHLLEEDVAVPLQDLDGELQRHLDPIDGDTLDTRLSFLR
jgi:hypothetical protein